MRSLGPTSGKALVSNDPPSEPRPLVRTIVVVAGSVFVGASVGVAWHFGVWLVVALGTATASWMLVVAGIDFRQRVGSVRAINSALARADPRWPRGLLHSLVSQTEPGAWADADSVLDASTLDRWSVALGSERPASAAVNVPAKRERWFARTVASVAVVVGLSAGVITQDPGWLALLLLGVTVAAAARAELRAKRALASERLAAQAGQDEVPASGWTVEFLCSPAQDDPVLSRWAVPARASSAAELTAAHDRCAQRRGMAVSRAVGLGLVTAISAAMALPVALQL